MPRMLNKNAKRLMIVHNFSGILRIMISTFLSVFLFKEGGYLPLILFNSIQYAILPFLYCVFAKKVKFNKLLILFRIGIFLSFLFSAFLVLFQDILPNIIIVAAIFYGIALSFYWYAYNLLIYHFNDLDQRIRYLGYSKALDKVINIITPIVLGSFIAIGSYDTLFIVMMIVMALLFLYSLKLEIHVKEPKPLHLKSYVDKVFHDKDIIRLYRIAFVEGFSGDALGGMIFPILIFMAFQSEFSLGSLKSVFAILSMIVSYIVGSKAKGNNIMKMTSTAIVFLFFASFLYFIPLSPAIVILYNVLLNTLGPLRDLGYSHYAYNIIDLENLKEDSTEHFILREFAIDFGRIVSYLLVFLVLSFSDQAIYYQILVCIITTPTLFILWDLFQIEKKVKSILETNESK